MSANRQPPPGTDIEEDPRAVPPEPQRSKKAASESRHEDKPLRENQQMVVDVEDREEV